jgi:hypothetical protein
VPAGTGVNVLLSRRSGAEIQTVDGGSKPSYGLSQFGAACRSDTSVCIGRILSRYPPAAGRAGLGCGRLGAVWVAKVSDGP